LAQSEGDSVVLVLNNGKKFNGSFVSRDDANVRIRMGRTEISLPSSFVASIEKTDTDEPAPAPSPAARGVESDGPAAPASGGDSHPAKPETGNGAEGEPKGAMLVLKDGTVIEGFVVFRSGGRILIVPGKPIEVDEADVEESYGETEPAAAASPGGLKAGADDVRGVVAALDSNDHLKVAAAKAVLKEMYSYKEIVPALIEGLTSLEGMNGRVVCLAILDDLRNESAIEPILGVLRKDKDPYVRGYAAKTIASWDPPSSRRVLLESAWQDRDNAVKYASLTALEKVAGPEEVQPLLDLASILPPDAEKVRAVVYRILRKVTGQTWADDRSVWMDGATRSLPIGRSRCGSSGRRRTSAPGGSRSPTRRRRRRTPRRRPRAPSPRRWLRRRAAPRPAVLLSRVPSRQIAERRLLGGSPSGRR
jgi:hypothetical protein